MNESKVLFSSQRPLFRAENIKAVFNAYDGPKGFVQLDSNRKHPAIESGEFDLMVTDEYPAQSPGQVILLWHAIAGTKKIGLDQPKPYATLRQMRMITYNVTSGTGVVGITARNSALPESSVLPLGMPRTDQYIGKKKGDGHTPLARKRSYFYAPTFRTRAETKLPEIDWKWIDSELGDDELMAVKAHMAGKGILNREYRHIIEIPSDIPSDVFLYDCDVVISDYSSIIFDGYLLGKPSVLFEKNPGYMETRGMYFDYPYQYSSCYATNERELMGLMRNADVLTKTEKDCINLVADKCDGHSCERICNLIREMVGIV